MKKFTWGRLLVLIGGLVGVCAALLTLQRQTPPTEFASPPKSADDGRSAGTADSGPPKPAASKPAPPAAEVSSAGDCTPENLKLLQHIEDMRIIYNGEGERDLYHWADQDFAPAPSDYDSYDVPTLLKIGESGDAHAYYLAGMRLRIKHGNLEQSKMALANAVTLGSVPAVKEFASTLGLESLLAEKSESEEDQIARAIEIVAWTKLEQRLAGAAYTPQLLPAILPRHRLLPDEVKEKIDREAEVRTSLLVSNINAVREEMGMGPLRELQSEGVMELMALEDCL